MLKIEKEILDVLTELDTTVRTMSTTNPKPDLLPLFERLDKLTLELPRESSPDLRHYMHRKSYEKARLLLTGMGNQVSQGNWQR
jgi:hypothetical protein